MPSVVSRPDSGQHQLDPRELDPDDLVALRRVPELLPTVNGRPVKPATVMAWARRGIKGVVLRSVIVGARRFTTRRALGEFLAALTDLS